VDLKAAPAEGDTVSAHTALQRDFPDVYFSLFGGKRIRKGRGRRSPARPISFRVDWDVERNSFVATVPEYPLIEARGGDWDEAFYALKTACRLQEYILRLDRLVAPPEKV
jgi:predicted RNase H-like HicB family nuclease